MVIVDSYCFNLTAVADVAGTIVINQSVLSAREIFVLLSDGHSDAQAT